MGKPVTFKTPNGETMVVISLADYETLAAAAHREDATDVAAYDEATARLARGEDRRLGPEEMAAFYVRPGFLRGVRKAKGLTQAELARDVGIGQGFLSDIEAGRRRGSSETMHRVAQALGLASPP